MNAQREDILNLAKGQNALHALKAVFLQKLAQVSTRLASDAQQDSVRRTVAQPFAFRVFREDIKMWSDSLNASYVLPVVINQSCTRSISIRVTYVRAVDIAQKMASQRVCFAPLENGVVAWRRE